MKKTLLCITFNYSYSSNYIICEHFKVFMAGACGYELKDRTTTFKYKNKNLVDNFERYHSCEDLEYQIHN